MPCVNVPRLIGERKQELCPYCIHGDRICRCIPIFIMLVPAGGLDTDGMQWIRSQKNFFLPIRALSKIFRARVMFLLLGALFDKVLKIPESWKDRNVAKELTIRIKEKEWVVHAEKTRWSPVKVIEYLGRYIPSGCHFQSSNRIGRRR